MIVTVEHIYCGKKSRHRSWVKLFLGGEIVGYLDFLLQSILGGHCVQIHMYINISPLFSI